MFSIKEIFFPPNFYNIAYHKSKNCWDAYVEIIIIIIIVAIKRNFNKYNYIIFVILYFILQG